jgi:hypothetical protein
MSPDLCLSAIYIGASAIEFRKEGGIRLSYHAGESERHCKELLFQCPVSSKGARVILASPAKIGNPGGRVLDILTINDVDTSVPIYLVTAEPRPDDTDAQERFRLAREIFRGQEMQSRLREKHLRFRWRIVDRADPLALKAKDPLDYPDQMVPAAPGQNQRSLSGQTQKERT